MEIGKHIFLVNLELDRALTDGISLFGQSLLCLGLLALLGHLLFFRFVLGIRLSKGYSADGGSGLLPVLEIILSMMISFFSKPLETLLNYLNNDPIVLNFMNVFIICICVIIFSNIPLVYSFFNLSLYLTH